jgi:hypothetical protein
MSPPVLTYAKSLDKPSNVSETQRDVPLARLLLRRWSILDKGGVPATKLGDSTGRIEPDFLSI